MAKRMNSTKSSHRNGSSDSDIDVSWDAH